MFLIRTTVSELTGEVRDLQRKCNEPEVQVEEEELPIPERAESPPARLVVQYENRLVSIDDEVVEIQEEEFYRNVGVVPKDTPVPRRKMTPLITVTDTTLPRNRWPALEFDPYAEFVPDSEPNSDTELPDYGDLSDGQINKPVDFCERVSRRKLARIETNPYTNELLNRGVEFVTEANETFNSVLEASVLHMGNVGSMLMDEVAHVNECIDGRREEIEALENWKEEGALDLLPPRSGEFPRLRREKSRDRVYDRPA
ncbi:hypothetical protein BJ322DRAFT_1021418 [Thelephora terrestris]|uniref:Uncharacterized protein n=1 Tax=Thelephora terrestris TaxID=56493 RepID=A0A9P6HFD2_9AGAM|nr:hypothetical protein BJ322DRAFT_1021418 [Thelephora terrestris]